MPSFYIEPFADFYTCIVNKCRCEQKLIYCDYKTFTSVSKCIILTVRVQYYLNLITNLAAGRKCKLNVLQSISSISKPIFQCESNDGGLEDLPLYDSI